MRTQAERVAGPPHALEERRDPPRRPDLAHEVDAADVDAELQRGRRHQRLELTRLQPLLHAQPSLLRERPVMARNRVFTEAFRQLVRDPLGLRPRVHEDERGLVLDDQRGQPVVEFPHLFLRRDRLEVARRHLDVQFEVALVAEVEHLARSPRTDEEARNLVDRALRRGQPHALRHLAALAADGVVDPFEGEREV